MDACRSSRITMRVKHTTLLLGVLSVLLWTLGLGLHAQQPTAPPPAVPIDPITAILDAFKSHDVVALGDGGHGNEQSQAVRLSLLRDPRLAGVFNDIVVESGNAFYQDVIDRFIRGEDVPYNTLR